MSSYRLIVRAAEAEIEQGTGWFAGDGLLCTAFHVVGNCAARSWLHQIRPGVTYALEGPNGSVPLRPLTFDAGADIALLVSQEPVGDPLPLTNQPRKNLRWQARGFPGFHEGQPFALSGAIVESNEGDSSRAVQLLMDQQADVPWGGVSGAAVIAEGRVEAVLTNVTSGTATAWAAPASALERLLASARILSQLRQSVAQQEPSPERDRYLNLLDAPDITQIPGVVEHLRRARGEDQGLADLQGALAQFGRARRGLMVPPDRLLAFKEQYGVAPVRDGARLFRPLPEREFQDIFRVNATFGGRRAELDRLDRFVSLEERGYWFVTGGSGFGKTAFLARWIETLRRRGEAVCFHFFASRIIPESIEASHALARLCEQLLTFHQLGGELPGERIRLQALYADLLSVPAPEDRPLVIVLDALDEALDTVRPGPALFPTLARGVHVVFAARPVADVDWPSKLGLQLDDDHVTRLGQLRREEIAELFAAAGAPVNEATIGRLHDITGGDPFYVADLVRVAMTNRGDLDAIEKLPGTHSAYLRDWWDEGVGRVEQGGFIDLMGTLAALRAPLSDRELVDISREDKLEAGSISVLLKKAARYVDSDNQRRFWLRHDRIRAFVAGNLGDQMRTYRERAVAFAQRWNDVKLTPAAREYGRKHVLGHLLADGRIDDAVQTLDARFIAARWREDGSYAPLLADLDDLLDWAAATPQDRAGICRAPAFAVMRESARDMMRHLPPELYRCWIRLKGNSRVAELIEALPSHRGEAWKPLLAVADEVLSAGSNNGVAIADRAWAGDLIERTVSLLPLVRTSHGTLEAWAEVCRLLAEHRLDPAQAQTILQRGQTFLDGISDDQLDLKAVCCAHLAVAALPWDRATSAALLDQADRIGMALPIADQALILARAFPAYRALDREEVARRAAQLLASFSDRPQAALCRDPLLELLEASALGGDAGAESVAREQVEVPAQTPEEREPVPPALLFRLGLTDHAWHVLRTMKATDLEQAAANLVDCLPAAPDQREAICTMIREIATEAPPAPALARALMCAGDLKPALSMLERLDEKKLPDTVPQLVDAAILTLEGGERDAAIVRLSSHLNRIERDAAPQTTARVALSLSRAGHPKTKEVFGSALHQGLSNLPEGDLDQTRHLVALALATAGDFDRAMAIAHGCTWVHRRAEALVSVLKAAPAGSAEQDRIGGLIRQALADAGGDSTFLDDTTWLAADAADILAASGSPEAEKIFTLARSGSHLAALIQNARLSGREQPESLIHLAEEMIERLMMGGSWIWGPRAVSEVGGLLVEAVRRDPAAGKLVERLLSWAASEKTEEHRTFSALAAVAELDPTGTSEIFGQGLIEITPNVGGEHGESLLTRMINELLGQRRIWIRSLSTVLNSIVAAAPHLPDLKLGALLDLAWARVMLSRDDAVSFAEAAQTYYEIVSRLSANRCGFVERALEATLPTLTTVLPPARMDGFLRQATFALGQNGHTRAARSLAQLTSDEQIGNEVAAVANLFAFYHALDSVSPVEKHLFEMTDQKGIAALVTKRIRDGEIDDALNELVGFLKEGNVRYQLLERASLLVPLALARWGVEGVVQIIDTLEDFDRRLVEAAALTGARGAGAPEQARAPARQPARP
jgi:hypothetical protein